MGLAQTTTLNSSTNALIQFTDTIDGGEPLIISNSGGSIAFGGVVGYTTKLASLNASAAAISLPFEVETTGNQTYGGAVTTPTNGSVGIVSSTGTVTFTGTLDSPTSTLQDVQITAGAAVNFLGSTVTPTSGGNGLRSLTISAPTITLGGTVTTSLDQSYTGATAVQYTTAFDSTGGSISFNGTLDTYGNNEAVSVTANNTATFGGSVGTIEYVTGLTVTAAGIVLAGPMVHTTSAQSYTGAITLTGDVDMTPNSSPVTITGTVDGGHRLEIDTGGSIAITGSIGAGTALTSLYLNAPSGNTTLGSSGITTVATTGDLSISGPVVIAGQGVTFSSGNNIHFGSTIIGTGDYAQQLTISATGDVFLGGDIGDTNPPYSVTIAAASLSNGLPTIASYTQPSICVDSDLYGTCSAASLNLSQPITLGGAATITGSSTIEFQSTIDGNYDLTISNGGNIVQFDATVGGTTALASLSVSAGGINFGAPSGSAIQIVTNGAQTFSGPTTVNTSTTLTSINNSMVQFAFGSRINSYDGSENLTIAAGSVSFGDQIGPSTPLSNLYITANAGGTIAVPGLVATYGDQTFTGPVVMTGGTTFSSSSGTVRFNGTLDGAYDASVQGASVEFDGAVGEGNGGSTPLSSLTVSIDGGAISFPSGAQVLTAGAQSYSGAIALGGTSSFTSNNSGISFGGTVDGAAAMTYPDVTVTANGTVSFAADVGGTNELGSLTVSGGEIDLTSATENSIHTFGSQSYAGNLVLSAETTTLTSDNGSITISNPIDSTRNQADLTLAAAYGTVTAESYDGQPLGGLYVTAVTYNGPTQGEEVALNFYIDAPDGNVMSNCVDSDLIGSCSASQLNLTQPITLGGDATIVGNGTGTLDFTSTIDGAHNLSITNSGGTISLTGVIGGTTPLSSLTLTASGITLGTTVNTAGDQTYTGPVALAGATTLASVSGLIHFTNTIDGTYDLTITNTGNVQFDGAIGGGTALDSLNVTGGTIALPGTVVTATDQNYYGAVTLSGATSITSNDAGLVHFASFIDGAEALTVTDAGGAVVFDDVIGGMTTLASLNITAGTISLPLTVITSGSQTYSGASTVWQPTAQYQTTGGGGITFAGTLDLNPEDSEVVANVTVSAGGAVSFDGAVGGNLPFNSLIVTGSTIFLPGAVTTTGPQSYSGPVQLGADATLTASAGVTFVGAIGSETVPVALTVIDTYAGDTVAFNGPVGSGTALSALQVTASKIDLGGNVTTTGLQSYTGATMLDGTYTTTNAGFTVFGATGLAGNTSVSTGTGQIEFNGTVDGPQSLTLTGGDVSLGSAVGNNSALGALTVAGSTIFLPGTVTTTGPQSYTGPVRVDTGTTITAVGGISFSGTINSADDQEPLTLVDTQAGDTIAIGGAVGAQDALVSLQATASTIILDGNVTTAGLQSYTGSTILDGAYATTNAGFTVAGATTLGGNTSVSTGTGAIQFTGTIDGAQSLGLTGGSVTLSGAVGGVTPLGALSVMSTGGFATSAPVTVSGALQLSAAGTITLGSTLNASTANIESEEGDIVLNGSLTTTGADISSTVAATLLTTELGSITINGPVTSNGSVDLEAGGAVALHNVFQSMASVVVNAGGGITSDATITFDMGGGGGLPPAQLQPGNLTFQSSDGNIAITGSIAANTPTTSTVDLIVNAGTISIGTTIGGTGTISAPGGFVAGVGPAGQFIEYGGATISSANGAVVIGLNSASQQNTASSTASIGVLGTIQGATGVEIASAGADSEGGGSITVGSTANIQETNTGISNAASSADVLFYTGPGGSLTFNEGATVKAASGNIAFIADSFVLNTPSAVSTVSALAGTLIYSPASTSGTFQGPSLTLGAQGGSETLSVGGTSGQLTQNLINFLTGSGTGSNATPGQNGASNALQIGLPGTGNTVSISNATFLGNTTIYGGGSIPDSIGVGSAVSADGNLTLIGSGLVQVSGALSVTGLLDVNAGSFTELGTTITAGSGIIIAPLGSSAPITIDGTLSSQDIVLLASDATQAVGGAITLNGGAVIENTKTGANTGATVADTVFYAGPGGTITVNANVQILGGSANVAFVADTLHYYGDSGGDVAGGTASTISTTGHVILSPASSDGLLTAGITPNGGTAINLATPSDGIAPITLGSGEGSLINQAGATLFGSNAGALQIGLPENTAALSLSGAINIPAAVTFYAGDIVLPSGTALTDTSGITFQTGRGGDLSIDAGASITTGSASLALLTDNLGFTGTGTPTIQAGGVLIGTGTNGAAQDTEPTITVGGPSVETTGLYLSAQNFATLTAAIGSTPFTIGDATAPVAVSLVGPLSETVTNLTLDSDNATLNGGVTFASFTTAAPILLAGSVTTSGSQTYLDPVVLSADTTLTSSGGSIHVAGTIDGTTLGSQSLTLSAPAGNIALDSVVGGKVALDNFTLTANTATLPSIFTTGSQTVAVSSGTLEGTHTFSSTFTASGELVLIGDTTLIDTTSGDINIGMGITGAHALTIDDTVGTVRLTGGTDAANPLTSLSITAQSIMLGGAITTTGVQSYTGPLTLASNAMLDATGQITLAGTIDGPHTLILASSGGLVISGAIGAVTALTGFSASGPITAATLNVTAGTIALGNVTTTGAQSYTGATTLDGTYGASSFAETGAVVLGGATSITASAGNVTFGGTVDGAQSLALTDTTGTVGVAGLVGGKTALSSLTINAATISVGSVTTTGAQTYDGAMTFNGTYSGGGLSATGADTLAGATTIMASAGAVDLSGSLNGAESLVVSNTTGSVALAGPIGATAALGSVTIAGSTISTGSVTTTGAQTYTGATTLDGTYTGSSFATTGSAVLSGATTVTATSGNIAIGGTIDGAQSLTLASTGGTITVAGAVGGNTALSNLTLAGNGQTVDFNAAVTTTQLTDTRSSGSLTLAGGLATADYTAAASNNVLIAITGGTGPLSLSGEFDFTTALNLSSRALTLTGTTVLDTSANNQALTLGTVDGAYGLTLNAGTAAVALQGAVGAQTALASLTVNAGSISAGSVATTGAQTYNGAATLNGTYVANGFTATGAALLGGVTSVTVNSGSIAFGGTIDGAQALTLADTGGSVTVAGAVGGQTGLAGLTLGGNGDAVSFTGGVTTGAVTDTRSSGSVIYGGGLTTPSYTASASNKVLITTGGGAVTSPLSLSGELNFANAIDLSASTVTLTGATILDTSTNNAALTLGAVDGGFDLTLNAGTAAAALKGAIGAKTALASLTVNAGTISLGNVTTTGAQTYNGTTTFNGTYSGSGFTANGSDVLGGSTGVTVSSGNIGFDGTLNGAQNLVLSDTNGTVSFSGAVGGTTALGSLTVTASGIVAGSIATSGAQSYTGAASFGGTYTANGFTTAGPVTMIANTAVNGGTGDITFGSTVQGQFNLALASTNANIFFDGTLGLSTARLSLLSITGADNATVENNSSLYVHDFTASGVGGTLTFGNHSLESDDVVTIQATSVDGRVISTTSTTIDATSVSGIIQGSTVNVTATGAVSEQITADSATVSSGSFSGSVAATRSANIAATGDESGDISVSGGSATVSGANVSGSITSSGLAQISASQNVSADVTGGSVAIAAGGNVSGAVTATGGSIGITATNVSSTIVAEGGGSVGVTASGSITGIVSGGAVSLTAPTVDEAVNASSANITATNVTVTGTIGGTDAAVALTGGASNITQEILGATQQVASNTSGGDAATADDTGTDDQTGDDDRKKKKKKDNGAVYDFANQYIDNLIAGKKGN